MLKKDGAFTFRYSTDTLGLAQISYEMDLVKLTKAFENTYLVVQNKGGARTKKLQIEHLLHQTKCIVRCLLLKTVKHGWKQQIQKKIKHMQQWFGLN